MGCALSQPGADNADALSSSFKSESNPIISVKSLSMEATQPEPVSHAGEIHIPALQSLQITEATSDAPTSQSEAQQNDNPSKYKQFAPATLHLPRQTKSARRQASFLLLQESLATQRYASVPAHYKAAGVKHIGFGPMKKENQDEFFVQAGNFGGEPSASCFCVFDGHGVNGRAAAAFCCTSLPLFLETKLRQVLDVAPLKPFPEDWLKVVVEQAICEVFQETEQRLQESGVNLSSSGTTASVVYILEDHVWVAAVGDSRVVLCQEDATGWNAQPLTLDHRPSRPGEKARVEAAGGRVEPKRLASGRVVGEPRLWLANLPSPGLLLSRSLGDLVASSVGCTCTPEVTYLTLQQHTDRFLVLGSDGVWDVLTNEQVCDVVRSTSTPQEACHAVLETALLEWEERMAADNVTVVVVEAAWKDDGSAATRPSIHHNAKQHDASPELV